jgi:hypothetical protein
MVESLKCSLIQVGCREVAGDGFRVLWVMV